MGYAKYNEDNNRISEEHHYMKGWRYDVDCNFGHVYDTRNDQHYFSTRKQDKPSIRNTQVKRR